MQIEQQAETSTGMVARENNKGLPTHLMIIWKILIDLKDLLKYLGEKKNSDVFVFVSRTVCIYILRQQTKKNSKIETCRRKQK